MPSWEEAACSSHLSPKIWGPSETEPIPSAALEAASLGRLLAAPHDGLDGLEEDQNIG